MRYTVVDFETANAKLSSICQIGVAQFDKGACVETKGWLINPGTHFDGMNVSIHRISAEMVAGAPSFRDVWPELHSIIGDSYVVHHTHFDRSAASQACALHEIEFSAARWLDSARIVRRVWPQYQHGGFGLKSLADDLGIEFKHHDAAEDARAAGEVLARALFESATDLDHWHQEFGRPRDRSDYHAALKVSALSDGPLSGETCVFTGTLALPRSEMAQLAALMGANVEPGVNKRTTLVVVGEQDVSRLAGKDKSSKHQKAEQMAAEGYPIRILSEDDFKAMLQ